MAVIGWLQVVEGAPPMAVVHVGSPHVVVDIKLDEGLPAHAPISPGARLPSGSRHGTCRLAGGWLTRSKFSSGMWSRRQLRGAVGNHAQVGIAAYNLLATMRRKCENDATLHFSCAQFPACCTAAG